MILYVGYPVQQWEFQSKQLKNAIFNDIEGTIKSVNDTEFLFGSFLTLFGRDNEEYVSMGQVYGVHFKMFST